MELHEARRRIIGQHWRLIVICLATAVVAMALLGPRAPRYTASARLVLDTPDPATRSEAAGIADAAKAIATSPSQVRAALARAHVERDATRFAGSDVTVEPLGASNVLTLAVSDRDARAAAAVANVLARQLIDTRLKVTRGFTDRLSADLDRRIAELNKSIADADASIDDLTGALSRARTPAGLNSARVRRDAAIRRRDYLSQARSVLQGERVSLVSTGSPPRDPRVISAAAVPTDADVSGLVSDLVLAAFLGLVLGVAAAALIETFRPTLVGDDAVAREFGAPVLATLSRAPHDAPEPAELASLALHLRLAAKAAELRHVRLVSGRPGIDLSALSLPADQPGAWERDSAPIEAASLAFQTGAAATAERAPAPSLQASIRPFDPVSALRNGVATGLVVVAPERVRRSELAAAKQLLRVSPAPLLGVVTFKAARRARLARRRGPRT